VILLLNLFGAAAASLALSKQVVLQTPGLSNTLWMRTSGKTPVTAAYRGSSPVVHLAVVDVCPGADVASTPALSGE
jgi:hypothetical protein